MKRRQLFLGNWKMNLGPHEAEEFCGEFSQQLTPLETGQADAGIAPPFVSLYAAARCIGHNPNILLGAQNVHWLTQGALTGEVSPTMLKELGVDFSIVGHSERRQFFGETSEAVAQRAKAAIENELIAVVCVGESEDDFKQEKSADVVRQMLQQSLTGLTADQAPKLVVAYEPVWAIGTGLAATPDIAEGMHARIRELLSEQFGVTEANAIPIIYGGSTKPENIAELTAQQNVDGALVGGASLKPDVFHQLIVNGRN